jgi:hypothetical protein
LERGDSSPLSWDLGDAPSLSLQATRRAQVHFAGMHRRAFHAKCACPLIVLAWLLLAAAPLPAQTVWELDGYRLEVVTAFAPVPGLTPELEAALGRELVERADTLIGAPWDLAPRAAEGPLRRKILADLDAVAFDDLPALDAELDKVILLRVAPQQGQWHVAARELDVRTRLFGSSVGRRAGTVSKLRDTALAAMLDAFAPLGRIERLDEKDKRRVAVRLRAAALPTRDEELRLVAPGQVFRPVFRYYDRDGAFRRAGAMPWTFLTVESLPESRATPGEIFCRLHTGLPNPLSARRRGRVEALVLGAVPSGRESTLRLRSRTDPERPLVGYEVFSHPPGVKTTVRLGATNRHGELRIPPGTTSPLRVVLVKSGDRPLARLPVVPGLEPTLTAEIADDEGRLEAEGVITGLQERLVDLVTRREVLYVRAKRQIDDRKFDEARQLIDELRRLPDAAQFTLRLENEKKRIGTDDPLVQAQIDALFDDTRKLIDKHLTPNLAEQLWQDLRKAQGAAGA